MGAIAHFLWSAFLLFLVLIIYAKKSQLFQITYRWLLAAGLLLTATWFVFLSISIRGLPVIDRETIANMLRVIEFTSISLLWLWLALQTQMQYFRCSYQNNKKKRGTIMSDNTTILEKRPEGIKGFFASAPSFIWVILSAGAILAIQLYVPEQFSQWAMLGTIAVVLVARWIGVSSTALFAVSGMLGVKPLPDLPDMPDGVAPAGAPMPQATITAISDMGQKAKKFLV
jgi:hypothetical protein